MEESRDPMFTWNYERTIDEKGRIIIPPKFRKELGEEFIISRGLERCIYIYPMEKWKELSEKISSLPLEKKDVRIYQRFIFSSALEVKIDSQGRISIPKALRDYAGIKREVIMVGVSSRIEIWDKEKWEKLNEELEDSLMNFEDLIELYNK